ncbi:hypothetical protein [Rhodanobacter lindaniclasticus]
MASPATGGSCKVAVNGCGPSSSSATFFGVGYSTSKVSMCASQPQARNFSSMNSAFALSCGEPTWFGADAIRFNQSRSSAGSSWASKRRSRSSWVVACALVKPSRPACDGAAGSAPTAAKVASAHAVASSTRIL